MSVERAWQAGVVSACRPKMKGLDMAPGRWLPSRGEAKHHVQNKAIMAESILEEASV